MGFLDKFSSGASAASSAVGAVGGVASLLFGASQQRKAARYQQRLQMELNEQQQRFARANALTDYQRQRELTHDTALLEKQGRQAAGLSTAGDFGSGPATVNSTAAPSAGSAPSLPDPVSTINTGISQIQSSANSFIQNRAAMANAEAQELQNDITKHALAEKIFGAKGEGLKAGVEGKKAGALLPSDVQKGKDEAQIVANDLWKSNNDAAYASVNAFNNANALLSQALQAKELYEKAKLDKDMRGEELQLFKDSYDYALAAAKQNVVNLKKQGVVLDSQANANNESAFASHEQGLLTREKTAGQKTLNEFERKTLKTRIKQVNVNYLKSLVEKKILENKTKPEDFFDAAAKRINSLPAKVKDYNSDDWFVLIVNFFPALADSLINIASRVIPAAVGKKK